MCLLTVISINSYINCISNHEQCYTEILCIAIKWLIITREPVLNMLLPTNNCHFYCTFSDKM